MYERRDHMKNFKVKLMSFFVTIMMMLGIVGTGTAQVFADGIDYSSKINTLINSMSPSIAQNVSDWQALDLNKAGKEVPGSYLTNLESKLKGNPDCLSSPTDYERTSLGVLAGGGDPTNFAGMNLIEKIYNNEGIKDQGINAYVFALIALDAGKFNIPDGSKWTKDSLIQGILDNRTTDGGWSYSGDSADPDMTGMALSALAPYCSTNVDVKSAVDGAAETLSKMQKDDGGFASWGTENANSVAMVIIGLCDNNVDPTTDSKFIKNSKNPLDALLSYTVSDNSGFGYTDNKSVDGMATEQGYRSLAAYNLFKEGKGSVYKNFTANTSDTKVTGISLDKTSANLTEGDSLQLIPKITPKDATNTKVDWSSSDKSIAAVDENGKVTALKAGTATITATTEDGQKTAACAVTVIAKTVPDKTIHVSFVIDGYKGNILDEENLEATKGESVYDLLKSTLDSKGIKFINKGSGAGNTGANVYISSIDGETEFDRPRGDGKTNQSGWKYSINGAFPNHGCGVEYINNDGEKIHWIYVVGAGDETQFRDVDSISLDKQNLNLNVNDTQQFTASINPDNATDKGVTWESSDPTVAAVDENGKVTAVKVGTATITASSIDNTKGFHNYTPQSASCKITVKSNGDNPYPISVTGISLDKTSASVTEGDALQLTAAVTPKDATNTKVDWSSSDTTIAAVDGSGKITAVKAGTAVITAVSEDNKDAKAQCTVTVTENNTPKLLQITNLTAGSSFKLGDDAKVSVKAENNSGKDQDVSLIVALYNESNKFINYVCGKQTIKNGDSSILTTMMKLPEEGAYKLKAFIWDSLEDMNPLSDVIDIPVQSK
jgi:uncharacterized protein YjdB